MKHRNIIFLFGAMPLLIASSSVAYSVIMILSLWVFYGFYLLAEFVTERLLKIDSQIFKFILAAFLYTIYIKIGDITFPIIFLSLLPYLYLVLFSFIIYFCIKEYDSNNTNKLPIMLIEYSILLFLISFIREILGFGSVSLPFIYGVASFNIFDILGFSPPFRFFGTVSGTLIMMALIAMLYFWYNGDESIEIKGKELIWDGWI